MKPKLFLILMVVFFIGCATTHQPAVTAPIDPKFWVGFQKEWTGLDADQYKLYVFHNIDEFKAAPDDIKQKGINKWQAFYQNEPWPPDNPPERPLINDAKLVRTLDSAVKLIFEGALYKVGHEVGGSLY